MNGNGNTVYCSACCSVDMWLRWCCVLKIRLSGLRCGANLSPDVSSLYLRFELNRTYFYYYIFRACISKWDTCTQHFFVFLKVLAYHCWPQLSFSSCLSDSDPTSITQEVTPTSQLNVADQKWLVYLLAYQNKFRHDMDISTAADADKTQNMHASSWHKLQFGNSSFSAFSPLKRVKCRV